MFENKLYLNDFEMESIERDIICEYKSSPGLYMPYLHWHPHYEINLTSDGEYSVYNNTEGVTDNRPAIFIHSPYSLHRVCADSSRVYSRHIIYAKKELVQKFTPASVVLPEFTRANLLYAYPNDRELCELRMLFDYMPNIADDITSCALLVALIIRRTEQIIGGGSGKIVSCHYSYIQDALQYISTNLSNPCTIAELCERYSVGRSKLQSDFKTATGYPYHKYLTILRQTKAKAMLSQGAGIISVSLECGYSSESHFVKAFCEYWGMTPGEYLRSVRGITETTI